MPNKKGELTLEDLIEDVTFISSTGKSDTRAILNLAFVVLKTRLSEGNTLNIRGFGRFTTISVNSRVTKTFKNPEKMGAPFTYKKILFKPAEPLKQLVYTGRRYRNKKLREEKSA